jgi:PPOX class probable F420-dependent enzyme
MVTEAERLAALAAERHISITTYRRDGTEASTPVWVVTDDGHRLLVWSGAETWKVKRIHRDPRVRVAACDARGNVHGEGIDGTARLLGPDAGVFVQRLLREKYGLLKRLLDAFNGLTRVVSRKPRAQEEYIEILPRTYAPGES